jgi:hypothetical protein
MKSRYRQLVALSLIFLALFIALLGRPFVVLSDEALFNPRTVNTSQPLSLDSRAKRARLVTVNWSAIKPHTPQLRLNLFEDVVLTAVRDRLATSSAVDGYVWVGHVAGRENSQVLLSLSGDALAATIWLDQIERYTVRLHLATPASSASALYQISEVDPAAYLKPDPTTPDFIIPEMPAVAQAAAAPTCEDGSEITLLVAYTAAAREQQGGTDAMEALINLRITEMNLINNLSQVNFDYSLVEVMEVDYQESGNLNTDLQRLKDSGDAYLEGVHVARDAAHADLAGLYISQGSQGWCGLAYTMPENEHSFEDHAFAVAALDYSDDYLCPASSLAHEFGHNMGNVHERSMEGQTTPYYPYAYGYQAPDSAFRTIMTYSCPGAGACELINHWSNPAVSYGGQPTGVDYEANPEQSADAVRSMNNMAHTIANFRTACTPPTLTATATDAPSSTPTATMTEQPTNTPTATTPTATTPTATTPTATQQAMTPSPTLIPPPDTPTATPIQTATATATATTGALTTATASATTPFQLPTATPSSTATRTPLPTIIPPVRPYRAYVPVTLRP